MRTESYTTPTVRWPAHGRHILAQFDDESIVVYQAYSPAIGQFAGAHGYFGGDFSYSRMSWIKPGFLWMMYRSGWGTKEGQQVVLAVRLQWDPDHGPTGTPRERHAVQLGLRGPVLEEYGKRAILGIEDISPFVAEQRALLHADRRDALQTPLEAVYHPADPAIATRLRLEP